MILAGCEYVGYIDIFDEERLTDERIIRCRDCKHWHVVRMGDGTTQHRCSGAMAFASPSEDGYCAWGKEKER